VAIELAVGVQSLTLPAPEASRAPDRLDPVHRTASASAIAGKLRIAQGSCART
jgi:hypothetical protein